MTQYLFKGAAKRLTLSLVLLSALGGCAVYGPPPPGPYSYYGTDAYGQPVYTAPPVYGVPYYAPAYIGPPISLNLGLGFWSGGGGRGSRAWGGGGWRHGGGHH